MTDGSLVLINEVALEKYLYTVVPSEMPIKFGLEALKVQAVAARSCSKSNQANLPQGIWSASG